MSARDRNTQHGGVTTPRATRRAALLLEAMLALALLAGASALIAAVVRDSTARLDRAIGMGEAADRARAAIARIEAGLATPETLNGPAPAWDPEALLAASSADALPLSSDDLAIGAPLALDPDWRLEIETQPTPYDGLTLLSVTATREGAARDTYTLHQLARLEPPPADEIGDTDELAELIEREQDEASSSEPSP